MNRTLTFGLIALALWLEVRAKAPAQATNGTQSPSGNKPPAPIWSGEGNVPAGSGRQKVFLTPDLHHFIVVDPKPDGTETKGIFSLHNEIDPNLRVRMESDSGVFHYRYDLENGKQSKDSLNDFSVVIYPDPDVELNSAEWSKGDVASNPNERIGTFGASSGAVAGWTYTLRDPLFLKPGMSTNFTIVTSARPGFTSAETEHFPHDEPGPEDLPQETIDQLMPVVADCGWSANHLITLGPRYSPDDPVAGIASDYLIGIRELIRIHRLEADSPFIKEAIALLDAIASGSSAQFPLTQKPQNELESEILSGLELALQVSYKGPQ